LIRRLLLTAFFAIVANAALAESQPVSVKADNRIRTVSFKQDEVVFLAGTMGVSTMIVFDEDERIATVAMGDTMSWQAVPDQSKRFLFIKPLERDAVTNMNVVTSRRIYNFVLRGAPPGGANVVYKLRFTYPDKDADTALLAQARALAANPNYRALKGRADSTNYDYGFKGSALNKPDNVFDDGVKTYFTFKGEAPAIFVVLPGMNETLVNYRREGSVIVVDKVAAQWTLRNGDEATCVFNLQAQETPAPAREMTPIHGSQTVAAAGGAYDGRR
jgi:type IV secretion system protein VirB9